MENTPELGGETPTAIAVHNIVIAVLMKMDTILGPFLRIGLSIQRDKANSDSLMTLKSDKGESLRPNGQLRHQDGIRLLAKWEERGAAHSLMDAKQALKRNTTAWSPLYYGNLSYLVCLAAAGAKFQFCAVQPGSSYTTEIGPEFDMTKAGDRACLVRATVNLYRILAAVCGSLPCSLLPAGKDLIVNHPYGYQRTLYVLIAPL